MLAQICTDCRKFICQRCGTCDRGCETRDRRREAYTFPAFSVSTVGLMREEDWRRTRRDHMTGGDSE